MTYVLIKIGQLLCHIDREKIFGPDFLRLIFKKKERVITRASHPFPDLFFNLRK